MALGGLAALVAAGFAGSSILERHRFAREMELLREALHGARFSADSCRISLAYEEQSLRLFDELVDSLRAEVRGMEDPEMGGVPEEVYPEYLEAFEAYNDSVASWQPKVDSLRTRESACRSLVERHNQLSDSLRARFAERTGPR